MRALRRIIPYLSPHIARHRWSVILSIVGYGGGVIASTIIFPLVVREIIDVITSAAERAAVAASLMRLIVVLAALGVFYNLLYRLGDYSLMYAQNGIIRDLYNFAFEKVGRHSYSFFANTFSGSLVAKIRRLTRSFEVIQDAFIHHLLSGVLQLVGVFIVFFLLSPLLAGLFMGWCALYIALTLYLVRRRQEAELRSAAMDSRVTGQIADALTNILNVKIFSSGERENALFRGVTGDEYDARIANYRMHNVQFALQGIATSALEIGGMYVALDLWLAGTISTGTVVLVQTYFAAVFGYLWNLGHTITRVGRAVAETAEMTDIFDLTPDILDADDPEEPRMGAGEIVFDRVRFEYENVPVFRDFSLTIRPGERVGVVGHSGAGKSTITKLILRFADVQGGAVRIDGQDVRAVRQDDLRRRISYVPQDPLLFHRSLRENIRYGRPDASDDEMVAAAKRAHAHEFISAFPQGYDTLVGERGVKLSGGERQRVAIARALLEDAPILILDEATSSLDSVSERLIQDALDELMRGKTTIVVAHRLSTIQRMDRIIVLDEGRIAEEGTHRELLARRGVYHNFWSHQIGGFLQDDEAEE